MLEKFNQTADFIKSKIKIEPEVGIILGSGLGGLADRIENKFVLPYAEIPNFPVSTVEGHSGNLIFGKLGNKNVVAMQGRFHFYEGYGMKEVTFPVRVLHFLGVKNLIVSNAAGGLNPHFRQGDLMIITDHINFFPEHPLRGKNLKELGVRFPDMSKVYYPEFVKIAEEIAKENGISIQKGVYIGSSGPTLETKAEYRMFRIYEADATGMSTVPEVIVAHHQGMKVFGMSVITNVSEPVDPNQETTHEEVQDVAGTVEPQMTKIITELINKM
ncbi:MAG: purine-nucleoside phosphorylase [Bacteroidales bacterium]|nr:purine-nucleoside phosphorylase [Bacteroidales bacterium]